MLAHYYCFNTVPVIRFGSNLQTICTDAVRMLSLSFVDINVTIPDLRDIVSGFTRILLLLNMI